MRNNKVKLYKIGIILCIISLYFIPHRFRASFNYYFSQFNILFYFGFYFFLKKKDNKYEKNHRKNVLYNVLILFLLGLLIFISHTYSDIFEKMKYFVLTCIPIVIINKILYSDDEYLEEFSMTVYKSLKIVCFVLVLSWIFDQFFNNIIQKNIANYYNAPNLYACLQNKRFISIFGHPLVNATLMFSLLLWTLTLYNNKVDVKNYMLTIVVSFVGIAVTGSKSILLLSIILLCIYLISQKNFKYIFPVMLLLFILYKFGLFDVTLSRLSKGLASGDVSSGRNTNLVKLINNGFLEFSMFKGNSIDKNIDGIVAAFEYPIVRWAYHSGIIFAIILIFHYFIIPLKKIFKNHNMRFFIGIIIYILVVNVQDGLASNADSLIIFVTNVCLLNYIVKKNRKVILEVKNND